MSQFEPDFMEPLYPVDFDCKDKYNSMLWEASYFGHGYSISIIIQQRNVPCYSDQ